MINYFILAAVVATALVLLFGVLTFARGGEFNRRYGNKLMRLRILMQAIAVVLMLIGFWIVNTGS
ncbi:twin transmembrane helix small protein [Sneathiella sp. HT1-7]|uniref:twin transmembrane helix small protein n=1 Tax=Sneathiella sp. HT1-7 TaxID=2887192 RepID=UPI001D15CBC7|nr:twin transmembrane helix small protein [Sneathiella sp. HT1-7]MCC3304151.1 twin transmembrane helix small protein [Sneathiella sp. HT1-7]